MPVAKRPGPTSAIVDLTGTKAAYRKLYKLSHQLRIEITEKALKAAAKPVVAAAKAKCPVGGPRVGRKQGKKHLRDTIGMVYRRYTHVELALVGPMYPAGAHGHLVEYGHVGPRGERVPPHPFLRPAGDETRSQQEAEFARVVTEEIEKVAARD